MSLQQKLNEIKQGAIKRIPAETLKTMLTATDELRDSGIMDGVIKLGAKAPSFALSNHNGDMIRSETLLQRGAIVLSVFRGHW